MSATVANQPPRALYAGAMLLASALGVACAFVIARALSTGGDVPLMAAAAVGGGALVGFIPAVVGAARYFGVAVLAASVARLLIVLAACLVATQIGNAPARPLWLGAAAGALLILVSESVISIMCLAAMDRRRAGHASRTGLQESPGSC